MMQAGRWGSRPARAVAMAVLLAMAGCGDRLSAPPPGFTYTAVTTGAHHSCGVASDGWAYCWGRGDLGALGDGSGQRSAMPVRVASHAPDLTAISAGYAHTCALTSAGELLCWGGGYYGQLGTGQPFGVVAPVAAGGGQPFAFVSAGWNHTCALDPQGQAYCWGYNAHGQLGDGTLEDALVPVPVATEARFASISGGVDHTCGVTLEGEGLCWGLNHRGQLGTGSQNAVPTPTPVAGGHTFRSIDAGYEHSCGILEDRTVACWGSNERGELGIGGLSAVGSPGTLAPHASLWLSDIVAVSAGHQFSCAVRSNGQGHCWGRGSDLQLGTGYIQDHTVAQTIADADITFASISAGGLRHACGFSAHGGAYCWGTGDHGQLGDPRISMAPLPIRVVGARGW
jgi:alpha-tubulin suppressor-like RCC1 family protein